MEVNGTQTVQINSTTSNEDHSPHYPKLIEYGLAPAIASTLDSVFKDGKFAMYRCDSAKFFTL